jgi:cytochrome oxidase Cu insertion factor (SCO1/SenC/PrrC family)
MLNTLKSVRAAQRCVTGVITLLLAFCWSTPLSNAQTQSSKDEEVEVDIRGVKVRIPDLKLRDQDGNEVRFYSDLIKDKVVVLTFFYTSCTYICSMQGKILSELQSLLGDRLGKSVFLISVTTDPARDNPQQLKAWGARYKIRPGWTLVTGDVAEMNKLLIRFTGNKAGVEMHLPATFVGNDKQGRWTSAVGTFAPQDLLGAVNSIAGVK